MKGDLHVHSKYSARPSQWILRKLGCPESFIMPQEIYKISKARGMDIVTITDHNTVDGVLEIADRPDVLIAEEVTTYFPEDQCKVHVLTYGITEEHHREIQKIRENIYELVSYLNHERIVHAVAHPLFGVNGKLTVEHFDKMLILFRIFELNGSRNEIHNKILRHILEGINHDILCRIAEQQGIVPFTEACEEKVLIGGSDDHSGLNIGRFWTEVPQASNKKDFLHGIIEGNTRTGGIPSTPFTMGRNLYSIAYQYYRERLKIYRHLADTPLGHFLSRLLIHTTNGASPSRSSRIIWFIKSAKLWNRNGSDDQRSTVTGSLLKICDTLIEKKPCYLEIIRKNSTFDYDVAERIWFSFVSDVFNSMLASFSHRFVDNLAKANFFDVFGVIGATGAMSTLAAPYVTSFSHFKRDEHFAEKLRRHWGIPPLPEKMKQPFSVGHFTDTVFEINGVAKTLLQFNRVSRLLGYDWTIITSSDDKESTENGIANFSPVGVYALPEYQEIKLAIPPFLEILSYCYERSFSQIHAATPGPLGLAALFVSRILSIPIVATYHTSLPQYVFRLAGDENLESATWRYVMWFYSQMDHVFVPSQATAEELISKGLSKEKIHIFPRGVDIDLFHPRKASSEFRRRYGIGDETVILYVGRISRKKGLDILAKAFQVLYRENSRTALLVVGDGPYIEELKYRVRGTKAIFTGYLCGEELARAYASSDIFVLPSSTDTFGNVVLEAQASGLPVIVSDKGGPRENIILGETGLIFKSEDTVDLVRCIKELVDNVHRRNNMGSRAHYFMKRRSLVKMVESTWNLYQNLIPSSERYWVAG